MAPGALLLLLLSAAYVSATLPPVLQPPVPRCPCPDPALCRPLAGSNQLEVFVFDVGGQDWKQYDWSKMTTIATFGVFDPEIVCYAHANEVRVVLKGDVPIRDIVDQINRTAWILSKVNLAKSQFMDGINLDLEEAVTYQSVVYFVLTQLVKETTETFHREIPGSQVTFDVPWSPDCIDGRCYNYVEIANCSDFLFVMSYDMQSQIWDDCFAKANAPYYQTLSGIHAYLELPIDPRKLVLGVPWYGYDYPCTQLFEAGRCALKNVPFRGAPCSDAAGKQIPYKKIMQQVNKSITGRFWDDDQKSPYYIYMANNTYHEVWYDDPQSISMKTEIVKKFNLRGVGMWNANLLDYGNNATAQKQTRDMWDALHAL